MNKAEHILPCFSWKFGNFQSLTNMLLINKCAEVTTLGNKAVRTSQLLLNYALPIAELRVSVMPMLRYG